MSWNAANRQHEATIPLPIGTYEFKFVICNRGLHVSFVVCDTCLDLLLTASGFAQKRTRSPRTTRARSSRTTWCACSRPPGIVNPVLFHLPCF